MQTITNRNCHLPGLPTLESLYAKAGILPRGKGKRYDPPLLGRILEHGATQGVPAGATYEILGQFNGYTGPGYPTVCDAVVVTLPCGTKVPAYSACVATGYMICQTYSFKAAKP